MRSSCQKGIWAKELKQKRLSLTGKVVYQRCKKASPPLTYNTRLRSGDNVFGGYKCIFGNPLETGQERRLQEVTELTNKLLYRRKRRKCPGQYTHNMGNTNTIIYYGHICRLGLGNTSQHFPAVNHASTTMYY